MPIGSTHSGLKAAKSRAVIAPPLRARVRGRGLGDLAAVEGGAARRGDRPQAARRGREREALADLGRAGRAAGRPRPSRAAIASSGVAATHFCCTTTGTA